MQIVQVAAHIIPQPIASAIEDDTVLFAIIIIRLILAPGRLLHYFTWKTSHNICIYILVHLFWGTYLLMLDFWTKIKY